MSDYKQNCFIIRHFAGEKAKLCKSEGNTQVAHAHTFFRVKISYNILTNDFFLYMNKTQF